MSFFDSDVVRAEMTAISELQEDVYKNVFKFPSMSNEEKLFHVSLLEKLIESGSIHMIDVLYVEFHSRFQLTSEPEQLRKKEAEIINKLQNIHGLKFRIWH